MLLLVVVVVVHRLVCCYLLVCLKQRLINFPGGKENSALQDTKLSLLSRGRVEGKLFLFFQKKKIELRCVRLIYHINICGILSRLSVSRTTGLFQATPSSCLDDFNRFPPDLSFSSLVPIQLFSTMKLKATFLRQ